MMCACMLALLFMVNLMRGSKKNPSIINIQKCGTLDWALLFGAIIFYVGVFYTNVLRVQRQEHIKKVAKVGVHEGDISFEGDQLLKLAFAGVGGGLASAVGLGGGVVFNPILIGMGVQPQVSASTGMYMIMFSAFSNSLTFAIFGNLSIQYALWIGAWSGLGIYIFLKIVSAIIKKYKHPSIVVFCLGGVIALSAVVVPAVNTEFLIQQSRKGVDVWGFGQLC